MKIFSDITKSKFFKMILFGLIGAFGGYAYYYFIGCQNSCPITSKWYTSTLYGLLIGIIAGFPSNSNKKMENENE